MSRKQALLIGVTARIINPIIQKPVERKILRLRVNEIAAGATTLKPPIAGHPAIAVMKTLPHIPSSSVLSRRASAAWRRLAGVCTVALYTVTPGFAADAPKKLFNIPAGDAAVTLKQFGEQSGSSIMFASDRVEGVTTKKIVGRIAVQAALDQLLAGTPLVAVPTKEPGAYAIKRAGADPNAQRGAPAAAGGRPNSGVVPGARAATS